MYICLHACACACACTYHVHVPSLSTLSMVVTAFQVSLEFTSEDRSLLNYFGGSIEGVCLQLRQNRDSLRCHLDLASVSLMDSSISDKGVYVCVCACMLFG